MNDEGPIVGLQLQSRPQTLTIVRGMLSAVAELLEMDPELLDDLKTSVSEACNNVVLHAYGDAVGRMEIRMFVDAEAITVVVDDEGVGIENSTPGPEVSQGIGISVIQALARDSSFASRGDGGTEVTMTFDGARGDRRLYIPPESAAAGGESAPFGDLADGEVGVSLSPVSLLTGVLGRLARTLAAGAHFSLDRFSDVYLVTDTLAAHAAAAAAGDRITARMSAAERELHLEVGPFRRGSGTALTDADADHMSSPLTLLADEIAIRECGPDEAVEVLVVDQRR